MQSSHFDVRAKQMYYEELRREVECCRLAQCAQADSDRQGTAVRFRIWLGEQFVRIGDGLRSASGRARSSYAGTGETYVKQDQLRFYH